MNGLEGLMRATNLSQLIESKMGPALALSKMVETQKLWQDNFGLFNMQNAVLKGLGIHHNIGIHDILLENSSAAIAKAMQAVLPKNIIPPAVFEAINSINSHHNQLFENIRGISDSFKIPHHAFAQINSLQVALNGISGQIASIAAAQNRWDLLDDFNEVSEQATELTENFSYEDGLTDEGKKIFNSLIESILVFLKRNKKFGVNALLFLSIVGNLMAFHQYYDFLKPKEESATKKDLVKFREERLKFESEILKQVEAKLKEVKEYRVTTRTCKVMMKPKNRSLVIATLPAEFEVIILQSNHKWMYVSFFSLDDNLPETGWVLKKYLVKSK